MTWPYLRLESLIAETRNGLYKHADFYGRGTPILKMFNLQGGQLNLNRVDRVELDPEELSAYQLESGDILMNRVNTPELVGKCAVIPADFGKAVFESKNIRIRLRGDLADSRFVACYLNSPLGRPSLCRGVKHAIGMATINNADVRNCSVPLPALKEQQRIVELLEQAEVLRRQRAEADALAERILPALFQKMFGDPATNPKGWPVSTVDQIAVGGRRGVITGPFGTQLGSEDFTTEGPEVFGIYSVDKWNTFRHGGAKHISQEKFSQLQRFSVAPGDVLISRMGTVGRVCVVPDGAPAGIVSYHLIRVRLDHKECHPVFFKELLAVSERRGCGLSRHAKGAIMSGINAAIVAGFLVPHPPADMQRTFAQSAARVSTAKQAMEEAEGYLDDLFKAMVHRAFSGELTARWREEHMKELLAEMEQQARVLKSPEQNLALG
jgi:type I restriction enzyme S subunit